MAGKTIEFGLYCWIYAHVAPWHFSDTPVLNLVALLGIDLGYYWFHRLAHEVNLFWASHSVHHSSEEYVRTSYAFIVDLVALHKMSEILTLAAALCPK